VKKNILPICFCIFLFIASCKSDRKEISPTKQTAHAADSVIIDCNYTIEEALKGTKAPQKTINKLTLIDVKYYSMDGKIHQGQILTNQLIANELKEIFEFILKEKFPVAQVIPIVKYNWNDELSMIANNTYSFCYRNIGYSKHAKGMAIDINPFQNPMRWKKEYSFRKDVPEGAIYNPEVPGTFTPEHAVVQKFNAMGFKWGRDFKRNDDDHHFEKR